jgi:adenosine deaminase
VEVGAYPKIELHLHLDCSLSYEAVHAIDPAISLEVYQREFVAQEKCINLADFLTRAPRSIALMQTAEHLRLVVRDLFHQLVRDHVLYAEIRFAPLLHTAQGLSPQEVVMVVEETLAESSAVSGIEAGLLLCALRHFTAEQSMQTVRLVERLRGTRVVGLDLAGDEAGFPLDAHIPAFRYAARHGIARTAHAGEARGAEGIHLEICPTSNIQTNVYASYDDHPIDRLYTEGIALSVNTDTRTITPITLSREYERLHHSFGWSREQFLRCNRSALRAAFLPEEKKHELDLRLQQAFASCE